MDTSIFAPVFFWITQTTLGEFLLSGLAYLDVVVLVLQVPANPRLLDFSTPTNNPFWGVNNPIFLAKHAVHPIISNPLNNHQHAVSIPVS